MRCCSRAVHVVIFVCSTLSCLAVQRMGIVPGNTRIAPNGSATVGSRCLDEHAAAPTTGHAYVKVLTDNPDDITVQVGDGPPVPFEQAVREGKIAITGADSPGGRRDGNTIHYDPTRMRILNLTDQPVVVSVKRFTPVGTARHAPLGYDIGQLAGLDQREVWCRQERIAEEAEQKEREAKWAPFRELAAERNAVVEGEEVTNSIGMRFRLIPAGKFRMGSEDELRDERPVHDVEISRPFLLGVTEVTQAQYEAVMGTNPSVLKWPDRPVDSVTWEDAVAFCEKLSAREPGVAYRLPTEAEWEYACRAGSPHRYHWHWSGALEGDLGIGDYAWFKGNSVMGTHVVGKLKPNRWGLYDMSGNVWEWCHDWYQTNYSGLAGTNPVGPGSGSNRVIRGGGWDKNAWRCRAANRNYWDPAFTFGSLGFRVALAAPVQ